MQSSQDLIGLMVVRVFHGSGRVVQNGCYTRAVAH